VLFVVPYLHQFFTALADILGMSDFPAEDARRNQSLTSALLVPKGQEADLLLQVILP
jgi:hypothetical protein